jgi:hypothetical protein
MQIQLAKMNQTAVITPGGRKRSNDWKNSPI